MVLAREKVVQTELAEREYEFLLKVAKKRRLTIKEGLREAVQHWISTQIAIKEDPLFSIEPVETGMKTDSSRLDEPLYGEGAR